MKKSSAIWQNKGQWILEMSILVAVFAIFAWAAFNGVRTRTVNIFDQQSSLENILLYISIFSGTVPVFYLIFQAVLV